MKVEVLTIDTDWSPNEREKVKDILYNNKDFYCSEIITFNTLKSKGAIRKVGKALNIDLKHVNAICKAIDLDEPLNEYMRLFPELFKYAEVVRDVIVSTSIHPCGTIVSPIPLDENTGLVTVKTCNKPVSMISTNEVNNMFYVKLDVLGLDNMELINKTCELANIERLTPDNVPYDEKVWKAIRDNTLGIFQWNSGTGSQYIKKLFSDNTIHKIKQRFKELNLEFNYMDLLSVGNGAIRPGGASYREQLANGIFHDNGHEGINKLLASTLGWVVWQEQVMDFLVQFCGYSKGESDIIRRAIAKKKNVEQYLEEIKTRFIDTQKDLERSKAEHIIDTFLQVVYDASDYLFSLNHSTAYSYIGYMCGWLREHYTLEFLTVALNNASSSLEKTEEIVEYAKSKGINILQPTFGKSKSEYFFDKQTNTIYKGIASIKYLNDEVAEILYNIYQNNNLKYFYQTLNEIKKHPITSRHIEVLIKIGYFNMFGSRKKLMNLWNIYTFLTSKKQFRMTDYEGYSKHLLEKYSKVKTKTLYKEVDVNSLMEEVEISTPNIEYDSIDIVKYEIEYMGTSQYIDSQVDINLYVVIEEPKKYPYNTILYNITTGTKLIGRVTKSDINKYPISNLDIVSVISKEYKYKKIFKDGRWINDINEQYLSISYIKL